MINETGGVNGRKLNFISLDDGYSAPKTVEQTRRLVAADPVMDKEEAVRVVLARLFLQSSAAAAAYMASGVDEVIAANQKYVREFGAKGDLSIAAKSICTATLLSSTSVIRTARNLALRTNSAWI